VAPALFSGAIIPIIPTNQSPDGEFRAALHAKLSEDLVQIFFNRPFRQVQLISNLLIELRLDDQVNDLPFSKRELSRQLIAFTILRTPAGRAEPIFPLGRKLISTATTILNNEVEFQVWPPLTFLLLSTHVLYSNEHSHCDYRKLSSSSLPRNS
jgi:hypothetical protein